MISLLLICLFGTAYASFLNSESFESIVNKVNSANTTWKAENRFRRHTGISSFKRLLGAEDGDIELPSRGVSNGDWDPELPAEFDARTAWPHCPSIRHIPDQGVCGSCWAVAGAGAMSDRVCIASNGTFREHLSAEELLSCCTYCGHGCRGGRVTMAWVFFRAHGLVTGGDYQSKSGCQPYTIQACEHHTQGNLPQCSRLGMSDTPTCKPTCTNPSYSNSYGNDHIKARDIYKVSSDETEIRREIMRHGPVEATFHVYSDFPTYKSGVYQRISDELLGGHAVRLIGWGTEEGVDYWLAANSWNQHWGDNGTFKIRRGYDECRIEDSIVAGIPDI